MINVTWDAFLEQEFKKEYFISLSNFLKEEYQNFTVFPNKKEVFSSFYYTDLNKVKVVIIGQDPYPNVGQACGLAFAVKPNVALPPSLKNIYQEIENDFNIKMSNDGYLVKWAKQGVLLLNSTLTVRSGAPNSHKGKGWEIFTDHVIEKLNSLNQPIVFLLWGNNAKEKMKYLNNPNHLVLSSVHPSPLSAYNGFFNNHHFSKTNKFLLEHHVEPIDWQM